jgi:hypothetical protein
LCHIGLLWQANLRKYGVREREGIMLITVIAGHKAFHFNDNPAAHYNWMIVKWLKSNFRFSPGILLTRLGSTTNTSAKQVGIQTDIAIQYVQNTCQMYYVLSQLVREEEMKRKIWKEKRKTFVTQIRRELIAATFCQLVLLLL